MTDLIEPLAVAAIVLVSAIYSVWKLMSLRQRLAIVSALLRHVPPDSAFARRLTLLRAKLGGQIASGCSSCAGGSTAPRPRR